MTPVQELRAQRAAVMSGTWVQRSPATPGEACLVQRVSTTTSRGETLGWHALDFVMSAVKQVCPEASPPHNANELASYWNDTQATHSQVIEVLDRAIKLAEIAEGT